MQNQKEKTITSLKREKSNKSQTSNEFIKSFLEDLNKYWYKIPAVIRSILVLLFKEKLKILIPQFINEVVQFIKDEYS